MSTEPIGRNRQLSARMRFFVSFLSISLVVIGALYALEVHLYLGFAIYSQQFLGCVFALVVAI